MFSRRHSLISCPDLHCSAPAHMEEHRSSRNCTVRHSSFTDTRADWSLKSLLTPLSTRGTYTRCVSLRISSSAPALIAPKCELMRSSARTPVGTSRARAGSGRRRTPRSPCPRPCWYHAVCLCGVSDARARSSFRSSCRLVAASWVYGVEPCASSPGTFILAHGCRSRARARPGRPYARAVSRPSLVHS